MSALWYYAPDGSNMVYKDKEYICSVKGKCLYYEADGWWYDIDGGKPRFYADDNWMYSVEGKPAFYFNK